MIVENPVQITKKELRNMARKVKSGIRHIFLHWTAGHYGQVYDDYHLCVDQYGHVYVNCQTLKAFKVHTWMRNHDSIAIALCCGADACCWAPEKGNCRDAKGAYMGSECADSHCALVDFGEEPPTFMQIEVTAKLIAVSCDAMELPIDKETVMTHCEAAFRDGYGPGDGDSDMRWDLWFLPDLGKYGGLSRGGDLLRGKALYYQHMMQIEKPAA